MGSLIREIQANAVQTRIPVAELLRHTKIAAVKLGAEPAFLEWIERELRGYGPTDDIPDYRKVSGQVSGEDAHGHEQKLLFHDPESDRLMRTMNLNQPLSELEYAVKRANHSEISFLLNAKAAQYLRKNFPHKIVFFWRVNVGVVDHVLNRVREIILDWALKLETAGVLGEDMSFTEQEREKAHPVTQHIYGQNIVVTHGVGAGASVTVSQQATTATSLDLAHVATFLREVRKAIGTLPDDEREVAAANIAVAETELAASTPRQGTIRAALKAIAPSVGNLTMGVAGPAAWDAIKATLFGG